MGPLNPGLSGHHEDNGPLNRPQHTGTVCNFILIPPYFGGDIEFNPLLIVRKLNYITVAGKGRVKAEYYMAIKDWCHERQTFSEASIWNKLTTWRGSVKFSHCFYSWRLENKPVTAVFQAQCVIISFQRTHRDSEVNIFIFTNKPQCVRLSSI